MSDKQVFIAIIGGTVSALLGGLLIIPVQLLAGHVDGGDDGWGFLWIGLMVLFGVVGFVFSAKWAIRHCKETSD